jgi:EpsI family protein
MNRHFVVTVSLLAATLALAAWSIRRIPQPLALPLARIPSTISGWIAADPDGTLDAPTLHSLDPTSYLVRNYKNGAVRLDLFIAFYAQQRAGESMHSPKACLPGAGWEIWKNDSTNVSLNGRPVTVNKYSIQKSGTRMLMLYWYQSAARIVASEYAGKFLLAKDTLLTGRTAGSLVRITLPDATGATDEGLAFAAKLIPEVQRCFTGRVTTPSSYASN